MKIILAITLLFPLTFIIYAVPAQSNTHFRQTVIMHIIAKGPSEGKWSVHATGCFVGGFERGHCTKVGSGTVTHTYSRGPRTLQIDLYPSDNPMDYVVFKGAMCRALEEIAFHSGIKTGWPSVTVIAHYQWLNDNGRGYGDNLYVSDCSVCETGTSHCQLPPSQNTFKS